MIEIKFKNIFNLIFIKKRKNLTKNIDKYNNKKLQFEIRNW